LPGIFRRTISEGSPLLALLSVMEALHEPSERILAALDEVFDPRRTRADFLPFLAHWVDLHHILISQRGEAPAFSARQWSRIDSGRLRELVANAAYLSQWRGTAKGLRTFLEITTGETNFEIEEQVKGIDGEPMPFHFRVKVPKSLTSQLDLIEQIVRAEKPAYVTYQIEMI
jgi:phage tail-like protein